MRWLPSRSFRGPDGRWDVATIVFAAALAWLWGSSTIALLTPQAWLARTHGQVSVPVFVATQPIPTMYTGENSWHVEREGRPEPEVAENCAVAVRGFRQHVPLTALTSPELRFVHRRCGLPMNLTITSRQRAHQFETRWRLRQDGPNLIIEAAP